MSGERKLLIVCALPAECAPIARRLGLTRDAGAWRGALGERPIVAATVGIGPERAERVGAALIEGERPACVLIAGVAGALRPGLAVAQVLIPAQVVRASDGERMSPSLAESRTGDVRPSGILVTVAHVVASAAAKAELHRQHRADAADMESAAIAGLCEHRRIAWLCVRAISDDAAGEVPAAAPALVDAAGRPRLAAAARHFLFHPRDLPPLLRLGRDTRAATEALATEVHTIARKLVADL